MCDVSVWTGGFTCSLSVLRDVQITERSASDDNGVYKGGACGGVRRKEEEEGELDLVS